MRRIVGARQGYRCKCGCGTPLYDCQWDHEPALDLRDVNGDGTDYIPPQHDAAHIDALCRSSHKIKTSGAGATTAGTDVGRINKERRRRKEIAQPDFLKERFSGIEFP